MSVLTKEDIDELLAYVPLLEAWNKPYEPKWEKNIPVYPELVFKFYRLLMQPQWQDHEYEPRQVWEMMQDEEAIAQADLAEVISMLTFCQRGERFSDGHWGKMLERGYIRAILNRLEGLRQKMEY